MTAPRPDIEAIFHAARDIPDPERRREYVRQACGGDEARAAHVEALLAAADTPDSLLDRPAGGDHVATIGQPTTASPGTVIGPYKLIEQVGEGGMGTVWMAQQTEPVKRLVALKLIKAGMDSQQVIARFEAERQALALMDHPNIARVLDGGTTGAGRPYFVMDLVKGVPLTRYCDEHRLTPRQRLELFIPVCQAVQHAHQKGIIHRDLKPSNVVVAPYDGKPVPKVIDFGVAKAAGQTLTDKTLVTGFGTIVGTLEYMSPEQAEVNNQDIDTRSDIYALGVLLYELLAGTPPFTRKESAEGGLLETLRVIREQEPTKPSAKLSTADGLPTLAANRGTEPAKLTRLVRGELDWVVMKALEKDRNRRYDTANGFAMDLQRYLADEPVQAGPPSAGYRLRKFLRRNRRSLVTAALLGAMLVVVAGSVGWMAVQRAGQHGRTAEAVAALLDQCEAALRDERADRAAIGLEAAERRAADGGAEGLADRLARRRADVELLRTLDAIEAFRWFSTGGRLPALQELANRWRAAVSAYGIPPDEAAAAEAAQRVNASLLRDRLLTALDGWLEADRSAWVRGVLQAADPDPYRDAVRDAIVAGEQRPLGALVENPEARRQPARFAVVLGQLTAVPREQRRAIVEAALGSRPGDLGLLMVIGTSYPNSPQWAGERLRWLQAAVAAHPESVAARNNLGITLAVKGDLDAAIVEFRTAVRLDPNHTAVHTNLGHALNGKGNSDGAIDEYREAIRLGPSYAPARSGLGSALQSKGDLDGAIAELCEAVRLDPNNSNTRNSLGSALRDKKDLDGMIAAYREALRLDANHDLAHSNLAWVLATGPDRVRDGKQAVEHAARACELTNWKSPGCIAALGAACAEVGDFAKAVEYQNRALSFPAYEKKNGKAARERLQLYAQKKPYRDPAWIVPGPVPPRADKP